MTDSTRTGARLLNSIRKAKETDAESPSEPVDAAPGSTAPRPPPARGTAAPKGRARRTTQPKRTPAATTPTEAHRLSAVITNRPSPTDADPYSRGGRVWPD
jgi:hypothetical protein